ncbi:TetR/AcrR family transcriptional regulator [Bradyrhizobium sp. 186]|uniref:TetR/AcrR family transcriptional regulator n=1 Tax=Bradyrhizobium sp. 186 TaxID=2782654 RepID=UPI002000B92F|nr:TetR/AcrR family transcriptional regulator [Bradyrhizobium sp. 186]UPK39330.1 TetR/AcrR family transcriptional regulator [Bradyrhizobium sp. 186]
MRYNKGRRDETATRILDHASVWIRERGSEGITVAALMKMAGLTQGGFYFHFKSRDDLINQAFAKAMEGSVEAWRRICDRADRDQFLPSIVEFYLAERHRLDVGGGCALPALIADVPRSTPAIKTAFVAGIQEMIGILAGQMSGSKKKEARSEAIATLSIMLGALVLARATGQTPRLSDEILSAGRYDALKNERTEPFATNRTQRLKNSASRGRKSRLPAEGRTTNRAAD